MMKTKRLLLASILVFVSISSNAQFTKLYDFDSTNGSHPYGNLISDGGFLYGMTSEEFTSSNGQIGNVFKIKPDGSGFSNLLDFNFTNGSMPYGSLYSDGTYLYGMTSWGGPSFPADGNLFRIKPDGTGFSDVHDFHGSDGNSPLGSLISDGTYLYGTTEMGGTNQNAGTVFKVKPDGSAFTVLLNFNDTNGYQPHGDLLLIGTDLFGMTNEGGVNGKGVIFKIKTDGSGYADILDFNGTNGFSSMGNLVTDGTYLYGMTPLGGAWNFGNIFKVKPDGTGYVDLLDFHYSNGQHPNGSLIIDGNYLYGMADHGPHDAGVIFKIKPDGSNYTVLHYFNSDGSEGYSINGSLLLEGNYLYGMTTKGGANDYGVIFSLKECMTSSFQIICTNDSSYTSPSGKYTWTSGGIYSDTMLNASSCDSIIFIQLTINTVSKNGDTLTSNVGPGNVTYQWIDCDNGDSVISGATGKSFVPTKQGHYAVIIWQEGGCTDTSNCISSFPMGIQINSLNNTVKIYPNPASEYFVVSSASKSLWSFRLYDLSGRELLNAQNINTESKEFNTARFASGVYLYEFKNEHGAHYGKLIVQ